jgi:hypothetical protein
LTEEAKESITSVERIVFKFLTVDRMAKGERINFLDLQSIGLIKADSIHKSSIAAAIRRASSTQVDTFAKIESLVAEVEKKISERKAALAAQLARIKALLIR